MAQVDSSGVNDAPSFVPPGPGSVITDMASGSDDVAQSVALQLDGKILAAGATTTLGASNFALVRYNSDGSLDTSFNGSGKVLTDVGGTSTDSDIGWDIAVQQDGKILLAGASYTPHTFALVRYRTDGHLDTTFNGTGKVVVDLGAGNSRDRATCLAVQGDGKIVVAGTSFESGSQDFALMRFNADGSLDTTFNGTGKLLTDFSGGSTDYGNNIALQADGKIVVAGATYAGSGDALPWAAAFDIALARYNTDGTLDTTFNGTGRLVTDVGAGANDHAQSVAVQADGKIVVAGYSGSDFVVVRYKADGTLDTTFNGTGKSLIDLNGGSFDAAYSVTIQGDGKIILAGVSEDMIAVVRLTTSGNLDTAFNGTGKILTSVGPNSFSDSVTVQQDGKIVVAGNVLGAGYDFAVVRYNVDGSLDTTFGALAPTTLNATATYSENAAPVTLDASVAIYDNELAALSGGAGNYEGATLTLTRHLGANSQDIFWGLNNLSLNSGNAALSGVTVGSCTNSGGTLAITFNANATQARINELLSSIAYSNSSDAPPSQVQIDWTFNDGNTGAQGTGGPLAVTGSTRVNITAVNDAPTLSAGAQSRQLVEAGGTANGTAGTASASIAMSKSDADGTASWDTSALAAAGWTTANGGTTYTHTGTFGTATLTTATGLVNYALDNTSSVTQALHQGELVSESFTLQVTDGSLTASAMAAFSITGSNDAPTASAGAQSQQLVAAGDGGIVGVSSASITIGKSDVDGVAVTDTAALLSGGWSTSNAGVTYEHAGLYGTASLTPATGVVNYVLDNEKPATKALLTGDVVTDAFVVPVSDGSLGASAVAGFSIWGATNAPVLSAGAQSNALIEAGGLSNGTPGMPNATIAVALQTVDGAGGWDSAAFLAHGWSVSGAGFTKAGIYGVASFDTLTGIVAYALNNSASATQGLVADQAATEAFVIYAANGAAASSAQVVFSIAGANDAPTLTSFSSDVATTAESTVVEVSIAALLSRGNEVDVDGHINAFIVSAVESGTLLLGTSLATATGWLPDSNQLIDGTIKVYWTPAPGANGSIGAFEVVAVDDLQAQSAVPAQVRVLVASDGVIMGTPQADALSGTPEDELVLALAGNDTIDGGGGADTIDGGAGIDTVSVEALADLDDLELQNVERVQQDQLLFAIDTHAATDGTEGGNTWQAAALYRAAFGAIPDAANLSHWTSVADQSDDMGTLAQSMIDYYAPGVTSIDLVVYLYRALVGVLPTEQQILYFVEKIGLGKPFEAQGDLFAAAASDPINTSLMLEFAGSVQQLDPGWF